MAIADDFSVAVNGDIRHTGGSTNYTVLELHRFLQDLADDASASGNDLLDITSDTPSERSTDAIITLLGSYNIDDDAAEYLYAGSITQDNGDTVYSGLQVLGAVNNTSTQLMVIQDNKLYQFTTTPSAPFWGTQSGGGYNGNAAAGILMRCLIKSRVNGADINGKRVRVQARHWGDTYDFFNVTLGLAESVAAIGTTPDAQNDTSQGTVTAYTHVTNSNTTLVDAQDETSYDNSPTSEGTFSGGSGYSVADVITLDDGSTVTVDAESSGVVTQFTVDNSTSRGAVASVQLDQVSVAPAGGTGFNLTPDTDNIAVDPDVPLGGFQTIDLNNGNGAREYYSKWTYGADTSADGLKGLWEYIKDLSGNGTSKPIDSLNGELFLGITHSFPYDGESGGPFEERETVVWGTEIRYDTLSNGPFTPGNYVTIGSNGAAGRVMDDDGTDKLIVALDDTSITLLNNDVITEYSGPGESATTTTAAIDTGTGPIVDNDKSGGSGLLLALDDDGTTGNLYIQLLTGTAPVDNLPILGSVSDAECLVNGSPTSRTVPKIFLGSYTGTLIGAYGIGVDEGDLTASDTIEDLSGTTQTPPNNVTFTVSGLVSGEDYVLVGPRQAGVLDKDQDTINGTLTDNVTATVVMTTSIPSDTPQPGTLRVQDDNGVYTRQPYTSYAGSTYTLTAAYQGSDDADATTGNEAFISYIDKLAGSTSESFTTVYSSDRDLFVRVRDGGASPIKTFEAPATLGSGGGSVAAIRTSDA